MSKKKTSHQFRQLLEFEIKSKQDLQNELEKTKSELKRKTRLVSTYKSFSNITHVAVVESRNNGALPIAVLREEDLRLQLEFNISRLKESEKRNDELLAYINEIRNQYECAQNTVINQDLLIKQINALNAESTEEIKELHKTISQSKTKKENDLHYRPRYVSALKNAIMFGKLLRKRGSLSKKKQLWLSNAAIWLKQLNDNTGNNHSDEDNDCDINSDNDENLSNDVCEDEEISEKELLDSISKVNLAVLCKASQNVHKQNGYPASPDEGIGLSPQLSLISQISSADSGFASQCSNNSNNSLYANTKDVLRLNSLLCGDVLPTTLNADFLNEIIDNESLCSDDNLLEEVSNKQLPSLPSIFDPQIDDSVSSELFKSDDQGSLQNSNSVQDVLPSKSIIENGVGRKIVPNISGDTRNVLSKKSIIEDDVGRKIDSNISSDTPILNTVNKENISQPTEITNIRISEDMEFMKGITNVSVLNITDVSKQQYTCKVVGDINLERNESNINIAEKHNTNIENDDGSGKLQAEETKGKEITPCKNTTSNIASSEDKFQSKSDVISERIETQRIPEKKFPPDPVDFNSYISNIQKTISLSGFRLVSPLVNRSVSTIQIQNVEPNNNLTISTHLENNASSKTTKVSEVETGIEPLQLKDNAKTTKVSEIDTSVELAGSVQLEDNVKKSLVTEVDDSTDSTVSVQLEDNVEISMVAEVDNSTDSIGSVQLKENSNRTKVPEVDKIELAGLMQLESNGKRIKECKIKNSIESAMSTQLEKNDSSKRPKNSEVESGIEVTESVHFEVNCSRTKVPEVENHIKSVGIMQLEDNVERTKVSEVENIVKSAGFLQFEDNAAETNVPEVENIVELTNSIQFEDNVKRTKKPKVNNCIESTGAMQPVSNDKKTKVSEVGNLIESAGPMQFKENVKETNISEVGNSIESSEPVQKNAITKQTKTSKVEDSIESSEPIQLKNNATTKQNKTSEVEESIEPAASVQPEDNSSFERSTVLRIENIVESARSTQFEDDCISKTANSIEQANSTQFEDNGISKTAKTSQIENCTETAEIRPLELNASSPERKLSESFDSNANNGDKITFKHEKQSVIVKRGTSDCTSKVSQSTDLTVNSNEAGISNMNCEFNSCINSKDDLSTYRKEIGSDAEIEKVLSEIRSYTSLSGVKPLSPGLQFKGANTTSERSECSLNHTENDFVEDVHVPEIVDNTMSLQENTSTEILQNIFSEYNCPSPVSLFSIDSNSCSSDINHNKTSAISLDQDLEARKTTKSITKYKTNGKCLKINTTVNEDKDFNSSNFINKISSILKKQVKESCSEFKNELTKKVNEVLESHIKPNVSKSEIKHIVEDPSFYESINKSLLDIEAEIISNNEKQLHKLKSNKTIDDSHVNTATHAAGFNVKDTPDTLQDSVKTLQPTKPNTNDSDMKPSVVVENTIEDSITQTPLKNIKGERKSKRLNSDLNEVVSRRSLRLVLKQERQKVNDTENKENVSKRNKHMKSFLEKTKQRKIENVDTKLESKQSDTMKCTKIETPNTSAGVIVAECNNNDEEDNTSNACKNSSSNSPTSNMKIIRSVRNIRRNCKNTPHTNCSFCCNTSPDANNRKEMKEDKSPLTKNKGMFSVNEVINEPLRRLRNRKENNSPNPSRRLIRNDISEQKLCNDKINITKIASESDEKDIQLCHNSQSNTVKTKTNQPDFKSLVNDSEENVTYNSIFSQSKTNTEKVLCDSKNYRLSDIVNKPETIEKNLLKQLGDKTTETPDISSLSGQCIKGKFNLNQTNDVRYECIETDVQATQYEVKTHELSTNNVLNEHNYFRSPDKNTGSASIQPTAIHRHLPQIKNKESTIPINTLLNRFNLLSSKGINESSMKLNEVKSGNVKIKENELMQHEDSILIKAFIGIREQSSSLLQDLETTVESTNYAPERETWKKISVQHDSQISNQDTIPKPTADSKPLFSFYTSNETVDNEITKRKLNDPADGQSDPKKRRVDEDPNENSESVEVTLNRIGVLNEYEEKLSCSNIISTAFYYHRNSLILNENESVEAKTVNEEIPVNLVETTFSVIQELYETGKPFTMEILNEAVNNLSTCEPKIVSEKIITILCDDPEECKEDQRKSLLTAVLTPRQKYVFPVVYLLCTNKSSSNFFSVFLSCCKTALFNEIEKCLVITSKNLTAFATALSRSLNAFEEMRWFIYDVLYMLRFKAMPVVYTMLMVWPKLMPTYFESKDCPVSFCISHVLTSQSIQERNKLYRIQELRYLMKQRYKFQLGIMTSDQAFSHLMTMISKKGFIEAMILMCKREGYEWTLRKINDTFIPMIKSWKNGSSTDNFVAVMVITLGYILRPFSHAMAGQVVQSVIYELKGILMKPDGCPRLQEAAAVSLCRLSRCNFNLCVDILHEWKPKNSSVSESVIRNMRYFIGKRKPIWWHRVLAGLKAANITAINIDRI